jgi:hypothetical protein
MANSVSLSSSESIILSVLGKELGSPSISDAYRSCITERMEFINQGGMMATPKTGPATAYLTENKNAAG